MRKYCTYINPKKRNILTNVRKMMAINLNDIDD